jgi:hypothetical protein
MAGRRILTWLTTPKVGSYIATAVGGSVLSQMGEHMLKGRPQAEPPPQRPEPHPDDVYTQNLIKMEKRQAKLQASSAPAQFLSSMDPRQWEMPVPKSFKRAQKLVKYGYRTSGSEQLSDVIDASKEKAKQVVLEAPTKPIETYHKVRKAVSVASGIAQEGTEQVQQRIQDHVALEAAHGMKQVGTNLMLGSVTNLVPGWPGAALRMYMMAKTVGNVGHSMAEAQRATDPEKGIVMQTVNKRLKTIDAAKTPGPPGSTN